MDIQQNFLHVSKLQFPCTNLYFNSEMNLWWGREGTPVIEEYFSLIKYIYLKGFPAYS